tara:strand:+ start:853 stop:6765 length:5913 start_codon:yes stop_codon:yes gene_type:complete
VATQTEKMLIDYSNYTTPIEKEKDTAFDFSIDQAQRLLGKGVEVAGKFTGIEGMEQFGADVVAQQEKDIEEGGYTPEYQGSLREAYQQGGIENALGWLKEKSVENLVSSGTAIAGTGLAAITAPFSIPASLAITGATIGSSVLMGAGESAQEMEDKTGTYDANVAVGVGALVGILDKFGAGKVIPKGKLSKMTGEELITALAKAGKPEAGKAIAARIGKATAGEAGTEALQESAIMGGAALTGGEYTGLEIADKIIDAAALGGTMGGATRGAGELVGVAGRTSPSSLVDRAKGQMEDIFRGPDDTSGLALAGDVPSDALQQQEDETTAKAQIDKMEIGEGTEIGDEGARQFKEKAYAIVQKKGIEQEQKSTGEYGDFLDNIFLQKNLTEDEQRDIFRETGAYVDELDGKIKTELPDYNASLILPNFTETLVPTMLDESGETLQSKDEPDIIPKSNRKLRDILDFPELYQQFDKPIVGKYGQTFQPIGDIPILAETNDEYGGSYNPNDDTISVKESNASRMRTVLIHEIQHAIQHRQGFESGDNWTVYMPDGYVKTRKVIKEHVDGAAKILAPKLKQFKHVQRMNFGDEQLQEYIDTIIYALASMKINKPTEIDTISNLLRPKSKRETKIEPVTMDLPSKLPEFMQRGIFAGADFDVLENYRNVSPSLNAIYQGLSASEKNKLFKPFIELRLLQERINVAHEIAVLVYKLSGGELQSRTSELRSKMAIQQFINDGKNPDEELRKLHPALDTRVLSKNVVDFFRTRKYKNIRDLDRKGVFKSATLTTGYDATTIRSSELEDRFGSYTANKIVRLNNQLNMEFENVDRFIGKLTKKQDTANNLIDDMANVLMSVDDIDPTAGGLDLTKGRIGKRKKVEGDNYNNFTSILAELSVRFDVETDEMDEAKLLDTYNVPRIAKVVNDVKTQLETEGLANIETETDKLIASYYLGYPIKIVVEDTDIAGTQFKEYKRPKDAEGTRGAVFLATNSIINKKIEEFKKLKGKAKKDKINDISSQVNFGKENKGILSSTPNITKYRNAYVPLNALVNLHKKYDAINEGADNKTDIKTFLAPSFTAGDRMSQGYNLTTEDIESREFLAEKNLYDQVFSSSLNDPEVVSNDKEQALELLKNPDAIAEWKKNNKVSKEELKRRTTRKFIQQTEALQKSEMSGKEYRDFIRTNQPATKFEAKDLPNIFASYTAAVGALKPSFSAKGIVGLTTEIPEGTIVDSRLDIDGYNLYNTWIASIKTPDGNKYGRTAVLKDVKFSVSGKEPVEKTLAVAQGKAEKSPFAVMKGEWQNLSDEEAYSLAETYINNPDYVQVGFNPERHSFFYRKDNMMPVFEAEEVVQIGALVLAKLKKENPVERIGKLRGLRIKSRQGGRPATFNEGGAPMKKDMQAQQLELFGDVGKMAKKKMPNDPISGNEIPKGSVAEEVRDDIPAQLSEGEFVLPADVVRYHGLEKLMKLRQQAKSGINMMDDMGQMGNSEEATMPDDMPFKPQMAVGGAVVPGVNIAQPTQQMVKPSIYSTPNIQPVVTPQVAVPTQPTYTAQTIPQYQQAQATNTAATPTFGGLVGAPFGQLQESTTKKYVNPETGEELYIPFVNGKPIYPIPTGFKEESEIVKEEEKKDPVASQTQTTQVTDSGGDDGGMKTPQTKEYQIASTLTGKSGLADAIKDIGSFLVAPGVAIGKQLISALSGKSNVTPYGTPEDPIDDPYATAADYQQVGLEPIDMKEQYARQAGYASLADMSANLGGVTPTFQKGTKPGDVSMTTGYTYNAAGESRADDGTVAYSSFEDFADNMKASVKSGWHGGAGYTKAQYDSLSDKAKENYKNHVSILSSVKGKDITPSYLKATVDPRAITTIKDSKEAREEEERKQAEEKRQKDLAEAQRKAGEAKRAAEAKAAREEKSRRAYQALLDRQRREQDSGGSNDGSQSVQDQASVADQQGGMFTAKGGFINKKPKAKKMKRGGLASRQ